MILEAYKAFRDGEFKSIRAAAFEYGKKLPGDPEGNGGRLYRKLRERRDELAARFSLEDGQTDSMGKQADLLASEVAGMPWGGKVELLFQRLRITIENAEVARRVIEKLQDEGLDPPEEFLVHINSIVTKVTEKELANFEASPLGRYIQRTYKKRP